MNNELTNTEYIKSLFVKRKTDNGPSPTFSGFVLAKTENGKLVEHIFENGKLIGTYQLNKR